jgi:hypothetical protein
MPKSTLTAAATGLPETEREDPVFAAIEHHRHCDAENKRILESGQDNGDASHLAWFALEALAWTTPLTNEGIKHKLEYFVDAVRDECKDTPYLYDACIRTIRYSPVLAGGAHV